MSHQQTDVKRLSTRSKIALAAILFGASNLAFAPLLVRGSDVGPIAAGFWRFVLAWPVLYLAARVIDRGPKGKRVTGLSDAGRLLLVGTFFAADLGLWHKSIQLTTVANATLLTNFAPVFVAIGGWLVFRRRCTRTFMLGLIVALIGTSALMRTSFQTSITRLVGDAFGLGSAVFYGCYILSMKQDMTGGSCIRADGQRNGA